jgi:hypothetical protein
MVIAPIHLKQDQIYIYITFGWAAEAVQKKKRSKFPFLFISYTFLATKQSEIHFRVRDHFLHQNQRSSSPSLHPNPDTAELSSHSLQLSLHIPIQPVSKANQNPNLFQKQQRLTSPTFTRWDLQQPFDDLPVHQAVIHGKNMQLRWTITNLNTLLQIPPTNLSGRLHSQENPLKKCSSSLYAEIVKWVCVKQNENSRKYTGKVIRAYGWLL